MGILKAPDTGAQVERGGLGRSSVLVLPEHAPSQLQIRKMLTASCRRCDSEGVRARPHVRLLASRRGG